MHICNRCINSLSFSDSVGGILYDSIHVCVFFRQKIVKESYKIKHYTNTTLQCYLVRAAKQAITGKSKRN